MFSVKCGVNIMTIDRLNPRVLLLILVFALLGCSQKADQVESVDAGREAAIQAIQATLTEVASRWHFGDMGVLYDFEFEYFQAEFTFDEYLEIPKIKRVRRMGADTLEAINVSDVRFFGRDSADVDVEAVFIGPTGLTSYDYDTYRMHFHRGRWIHATVSTREDQLRYEDDRRIADSAAEAEMSEEGW